MLYVVYRTSAQSLPLAATANHSKFKLFYFDVGALAEQWVLQEYIANTSVTTPPELFYWHREEKQSNAEVDFIFHAHHSVIPVEVKSGARGRLRSMNLFLETHAHCKMGLVISENRPWQQDALQHIPFYALESWLKEN